jgi:hypothetical protein
LEKVFLVLVLCLVAFALGFLGVYMSRQRRGRRGTTGRKRGLFGKPRRGGGGVPIGSGTTSSVNYGIPYNPPPEPYHPAPPAYIPQPASGTGNEVRRPIMANGNKQAANKSKGQPICPYCQTLCDTSSGTMCPECHTMHHKECWREYGGCTILGCSKGPSKS